MACTTPTIRKSENIADRRSVFPPYWLSRSHRLPVFSGSESHHHNNRLFANLMKTPIMTKSRKVDVSTNRNEFHTTVKDRIGIGGVILVLTVISSYCGFVMFSSIDIVSIFARVGTCITFPMMIRLVIGLMAAHPIRFSLFLTSLLWIAYFVSYEAARYYWEQRVEKQEIKEIIQRIASTPSKFPWLSSRQARESSMIQMGSLFIPTSFILLAAATQGTLSSPARIMLAISAPLLFGLWLFLAQLSTRLMDDVDSEFRLRTGIKGADLMRVFYGDRHGKGLLTRLRRNQWLAYMSLVIFGSTFVVQSIVLAGCK